MISPLFPCDGRIRFRAEDRARHSIDRVMNLDPSEAGRIFTRFDAAKIVDAARSIDARDRASLPLAGLLVSIKDLFDEEGEVTTAGSILLRERVPAATDAAAVARLSASGAIPFGRTAMTEFAYSGIGLNPHFGTPGNARDPSRIPGGSTSGGALSVALGLADAALGSDTGGSVRIPAALNGLAGFKPTQTAVPLDGAFPLSITYDSIGALAPRIALCAAIHETLSGEVRPPDCQTGLAALRIGVVTTVLTDDLDDQVAADFDRALTALRDAGADVRAVAVPCLAKAGGVNRILVARDAWRVHADHLADLETAGDPRVLRRIRFAESVAPDEEAQARATREVARGEFGRIAANFDVFVAPTVPVVAPTTNEVEADFDRLNALLLRNPSAINFVGGCAATIPMSAPDALATGLMLAGVEGADWRILEIAETVEALIALR